MKLLLENEGLTPDLVKTFVIYLISHNRTMGSSCVQCAKILPVSMKANFCKWLRTR